MNTKKLHITRYIAVFIFVFAFFILCSFSAKATVYEIDGFEIPVDIEINGVLLESPVPAFLDGGTTYVPLRALFEAYGAEVLWNDQTKTATVSRKGVVIDYVTGENAVLYKDTTFVPVRAASEALGFEVGWDSYYLCVKISAEDVTLSQHQIKKAYTLDDVLITAQILQCECGSAAFEAKLAVANVITNRVESDLFPDTVREVIYDNRYGSIQFTPAYNGKINNTPNAQCILASKCALSGTVVAPGCLFFQADYVKNSWMNRNRQYAMSLGGNTFFY